MRKSFTLVELMVIVGIIGLLAAVIVVGVGQTRAKGRDAKRVADINLISQKINDFYVKNKYYPTSLQQIIDDLGITLPTDPKTGGQYNYRGYDGTNCSDL